VGAHLPDGTFRAMAFVEPELVRRRRRRRRSGHDLEQLYTELLAGTAIQTGVAASAAVHSILCEDGEVDAAVAYYREHQRRAVQRHARLAARSYGDCATYAGEPFWRRRAAEAPEPPAARAPIALRDLLPLRVRLPRGCVLAPTPCVVGDRVEWRRALSHPALPRPVAFLGDSELAPLLDKLDADRRLGEVVEDWARSVTPALAYSIAGWLASRGLLDPI
jgi:hypothetical protein